MCERKIYICHRNNKHNLFKSDSTFDCAGRIADKPYSPTKPAEELYTCQECGLKHVRVIVDGVYKYYLSGHARIKPPHINEEDK